MLFLYHFIFHFNFPNSSEKFSSRTLVEKGFFYQEELNNLIVKIPWNNRLSRRTFPSNRLYKNLQNPLNQILWQKKNIYFMNNLNFTSNSINHIETSKSHFLKSNLFSELQFEELDTFIVGPCDEKNHECHIFCCDQFYWFFQLISRF